MKDKVNQMFKDKLFLVMMVIGLLTAVAAVGVLTVSNTDEKGQSPYLEVPGGEIIAQDSVPETAQKEEKAEEKISEIEASKVPQENYAQKEEKNPNIHDPHSESRPSGTSTTNGLNPNIYLHFGKSQRASEAHRHCRSISSSCRAIANYLTGRKTSPFMGRI